MALLAAAFALLAGLALGGVVSGSGRDSAASAQPSDEPPVPETDASVPASLVLMIGATPAEAPGEDEVWGIGRDGTTTVLVRYTKQDGWTLGPALPQGFRLAQGPLAGQMTPAGSGALVGTVPAAGGGSREAVLLRKPGGAFETLPPVPAEGEAPAAGEQPLLAAGEALLGTRAPLFAPLDEAGGGAGVLIAPVIEGAGVEHQVLHWDGHAWSAEPIELPVKTEADFRVLALGASAPQNAWLLGQLTSKSTYPAGAVALFRRSREGEGAAAKWVWRPAARAGGEAGEAEPLSVPVLEKGVPAAPVRFTVPGTGAPPTVAAQLLTVTDDGVWVDGVRGDVDRVAAASTTLFYKIDGAGPQGEVKASWCQPPSEEKAQCDHQLPEALPFGPSRSIAWSGVGAYGERVITGLSEGVSLSLLPDGSFARVLALGAGTGPQEDPGAAYGAAFVNAHEGWLGANVMPVHLTAAGERAPSRLAPWPTVFRHPLLAIAPQPGAPVGSLSSEAVAVGDLGAVARFTPGRGWQPESLFGPGQRVEHPRLRAVAWPTPSRVYAVGDSGSGPNMWLWRAETGLWEPDPATPLNFRGNLLGIAFDPNNPARGYAVGSSALAGEGGVLLRYGKTWTQETALPPQVERANFVAIAFAGSEAIVAYRGRAAGRSSNQLTGGLLVNDGSGWHVDEQAAAAMGAAVPAALAGLPDGGAAFIASGGPEGPRVFERSAPGEAWQATPSPLPGLGAGSLALFREGGALRAIVAAGGVANEGEPQEPPPGFPPSYLGPLSPVGGGPQSGGVLRQTAAGWSDEGHELNPAGEPPGGYVGHDLPYRPDPVLAVLVDPSGGQGWAVGGNISRRFGGRIETADVERYPADGATPLGLGSAPVRPEAPEHGPTEAKDVTFAVAGGAQCDAPCGDRALAGVGPDVWLQKAFAHASQTGVQAFLYTGPYVTQGRVNGPRTFPIPFGQELEGYASVLRTSLPLPVYAAASPQELDARPEREGSEQLFEEELAGVQPFGAGVSTQPRGSTPSEEAERLACARRPGCGADYYAFESASAGGTVRAIVLDDGLEVGDPQLAWLEGELEGAKQARQPAIVVGNADLAAQVAAGGAQAAKVAAALVLGSRRCQQEAQQAREQGRKPEPCGASAYFYDAPEENVRKELRSGGESIEEYGSGTLGYVNADREQFGDFHGASGFLIAQLEMAGYQPASNRAPVSVRLIPNIDELALEAQDGTLLRRSKAALFAGLARRPRAGGSAGEHGEESEVDPYIPVPENCVGSSCSTSDLFPEYTFSSSRPDVGGFVKPNLATPGNRHAVLLDAKNEPVREPVNPETGVEESTSGLFCAYNAGTTIVTISAGGLAASLPVTVQAGSVRQPCGTVKLKELPARSQPTAVGAPPPAPAPGPSGPPPAAAPPPIPLPIPPPPLPALARPAPKLAVPPFIPLAGLSTPPLAIVPPPVPTPARPTPPSGTSAVTSPIEVAEHEEEEESATESASAQAVAYRASDHEPPVAYLVGLLVLAALAGASARRPRRGRRGARVAIATITGIRAQQRLERESQRARRR